VVRQHRACTVLKAVRSSYHYKCRRGDQAELKQRIKAIAETRVRYGYRADRAPAVRTNEVWAMDFVHDQLATGTKIRVLTIIDTFSRFATHWFMSLDDAKEKCGAWRRDYNEVRPHSAVGNKPPITLIGPSAAHGPP
jgi:transposase InsO family protein